MLRSGAAFYSAIDNISQADWSDFVEQSKKNMYLSGVQGIGFSLLIPKEELASHIQQTRNEGFSDYKVWPEEERDLYTSIVFIEPFVGSNTQAFGYDLMTEPLIREALERSRDLDVAIITDKLLIEQEAGLDIYAPVYRKGLPISTKEQRRNAIIGWVYSSFSMDGYIYSILESWHLNHEDKQLGLNIFDESDLLSQSLLFESKTTEEQKELENIRFSLEKPINFNGLSWKLVFTQKKGDAFIDYFGLWLLLFCGIIINILLFLIAKSLIRERYNSQKIAESLIIEIKESERLLKESQEIAKLGSYSLNLTTGIWKSSEILDGILGIDENYTRSVDGWIALIDPEQKDQMEDYLLNTVIAEKQPFNREYQILRNDNKEKRWLHGHGKLELDSDNNPKTMIGTISDITESKERERETASNDY